MGKKESVTVSGFRRVQKERCALGDAVKVVLLLRGGEMPY